VNILIIIADQLSKAGMGFFGNRDVHTPNLDRLAENGVRFSGCYMSCPLCKVMKVERHAELGPIFNLENGAAYHIGGLR